MFSVALLPCHNFVVEGKGVACIPHTKPAYSEPAALEDCKITINHCHFFLQRLKKKEANMRTKW